MVLEFQPLKGFGPIRLGSSREEHHEFDPLEYCFPNQILTLWSAEQQYDYRRRGARQVWGQVGLGNAAYLSAIKALEDDALNARSSTDED